MIININFHMYINIMIFTNKRKKKKLLINIIDFVNYNLKS